MCRTLFSWDSQSHGWMKMSAYIAVPHPGCYSIVLKLLRDRQIEPGRLGLVSFPKGYYVYTGRDARNVQARIQRHMKKEKRVRWHIDYVTSDEFVRFVEAVLHRTSAVRECDINRKILSMPGARIVALGFGASDCRHRCESHLVYFKKRPLIKPYAF